MVEDRRSLGWDMLESRNISLDINGFRYNGNDKTPKRYWGKLINKISEERMTHLKNLDIIGSEKSSDNEVSKKIDETNNELDKFMAGTTLN